MSINAAKRRSPGAVLVFALLVMVTAALVIGGLAQLAATQSLVGGREWEEAQERVVLANSRAMARQFLLSSVFSNRVDGPIANPLSVTFSNADLGAFRLTNIVTEPTNNFDFWSAYLSNSVTGLNINPFNVLERGGFYPAMIQAELSDGSTNTDWVPWNLQVRTRNPIAAGFVIVWHLPEAEEINDGETNKMLFLPGAFPVTRVYSFTDLPVCPTVSVTNPAASYLAGNFGEFRVPTRQLSDELPSSNRRFITNSGGADSTIELALSNISSPPTRPLFFEVPAQTDESGTNTPLPVSTLRIVGEPDPSRADPAVLIYSPATNGNLRNIVLDGAANRRRLYLDIRQTTTQSEEIGISWQPPGGYWRVGMSVAFPGASYNQLRLAGDPITIQGGIRTDAEGLASTPNIEFQPETNPGSLDFIADQMMWLEDYRAP